MTDATATIAGSLRVHGSLTREEIEQLWDHWGSLETRLRGFEPDDVAFDLYVKDRDLPGQHLTLEAKIVGLPVLVATTSEAQLDHALNVVRDEMIRLVTDAKEMQHDRRTGRSHTA